MFERGEIVVKAGANQPMTVVAVEDKRRGSKLLTCEWVENGQTKCARFLDDQLELYFEPRHSR